ncbi:MAG: Rieske 2Fe-2S domain-containing protein [Cognaticolwellia sp.]
MTLLTLKEYFPAGGQAHENVEIHDITQSDRADVFFGRAILPPSTLAKDVVIYGQTLANGNKEYRTISAKCPHQGADISQDLLKGDGNVYCSLHKRPICIFSEYNYAFLVEKRDDKFFIVKSVS